jgi:hypothetical protein
MVTFDPDAACLVHDQLLQQTSEWKPEWATHYREHAKGSDVVYWDGLMLDGWCALGS